MEAQEPSLFETSEMMANFLASTTLLTDSWKLCSTANNTATGSFVMDQVGSTGFIAFSGGQFLSDSDSYPDELVPAGSACDGIFSALDRHSKGDDEPVMVHAGLLLLFLDFFHDSGFQDQLKVMAEKSKSMILTGHSIGGAIASLMALALLSHLQNLALPIQILCITFGSPLLGNESLSKAILRQRWSGSFCHVVIKNDIVPSLLFAPLSTLNTGLLQLLQFWKSLVLSPSPQKAELFNFVLEHSAERARATATEGIRKGLFLPFGNYLFCLKEGAVCVDGTAAVTKLLHRMLATATATSSIEDHQKYGEGTTALSSTLRLLNKKEYSNLGHLIDSRQVGLPPNIVSANLAIQLAKVTPNRAKIEWYKARCDQSDDRLGYYDSFKRNQASRKEAHVNKCRINLAAFWDGLIAMIDNNELPCDFHKRAKWVNASHFYQLLVEPLDIADYYRLGKHHQQGHYLQNGRATRHEIFNKWWRERNDGVENGTRSRFASLTQDSCFWARVEEAKEALREVRSERNSMRRVELWEGIDAFERYARELIESKEVSEDVLAKNSSYSLWKEELEDLKSELQQFPPRFRGFRPDEVIPRSE